uniref:Phospholipase A2 domain-containing protein n=1 Tax=Arcella intermedia TaxID=1963864 RepID=A0A6B2LTI5_9EUKA
MKGGYERTTNGCGTPSAEGNETFNGEVDFGHCCDLHDCHYDSCNFGKDNADMMFEYCLVYACRDRYAPGDTLDECERAAYLFSDLVHSYGGYAYNVSQETSCIPCSKT